MGRLYDEQWVHISSFDGEPVLKINRRDSVTLANAQKFIQALIAAYQAHGGVVVNKTPVIIESNDDAAKSVESVFNAAGNQCWSSYFRFPIRS